MFVGHLNFIPRGAVINFAFSQNVCPLLSISSLSFNAREQKFYIQTLHINAKKSYLPDF